jgi:peroxiredoxin
MITIMFGMVLPWLLIAVGTWLAYELVRQNGRILLQLVSIEKQIESGAAVRAGTQWREALTHGEKSDPSLARSRLNRNGLKAGTAAPDFRLPHIDRGELSLADFRGRRVLLVFSDPHCGPCDQLAPQIQEIHERRKELQVLVVSRRDVEANRAKAARLGLTFPIVLQKQWEVSLKYAMFATPIGYLIDEQGILASDVAVGVGPILAMADQRAHEPLSEESSPFGTEQFLPI